MKDQTEIEFVALNRAELQGGGLGQIVITRDAIESAESLEEIDEQSTVFKNGRKTMVPGGIYRANGKVEEGRIRRLAIASARFLGKADVDEAWLGHWEGIESAILDEADRKSAERKAKSDKVVDREVKRIAEIAARLPYHRRHAFVRAVSRRILDEAIKL